MRKSLLAASIAVVSFAFVTACTPPAAKEEAAPAAPVEAPAPAPVVVDVVDTAVANGSFTSLVAAVQAAGLAETLKGPGPFTVFAPNDDAFKKLPAADLAKLLEPAQKEKLAGILTHHVVPGNIKAADIADGKSEVETVGKTKLAIEKSADGVTVGGAKVIATDVAASNGVIHVVDTVIMPPAKK
jgi:uncharacterized surface protein with fasciclin (FAS1) repeats